MQDLDTALEHMTAQASRIDVCASCPATYAEATGSSLGYTTQFKFSAPMPCADGRKVMAAGIGEGTVTRQGRPTYWALTGQSRLIVCGPIDDAPMLYPGSSFRLPPIEIELERDT